MTYSLAEQAARQRASMVQWQLLARGIVDGRVLAAMGSVPRELFVGEKQRAQAYADAALPIEGGQTISQPYMVARTCELAGLKGHERVLEIGAGSGYQAAVLGRLVKRVVSIERLAVLAEFARAALARAGADNVDVVVGDGSVGYPAAAPYDAILVAAAAPSVPGALVEQLAEGGRLVIPVGGRTTQVLRVVTKTPQGVVAADADACVYVPLIGERGWPEEP